MIHDLDNTLKQLLIKKAGLSPAEVDISFDIPTRDWSTPVSRPTVNLYLYDIRENLELREMYWDQQEGGRGRVHLKRRPVRMNLSYMITCWTSGIEDEHRLLWVVLETFFRHSPIPADVLQGALKELMHPVRTKVAQSDGVLRNASDFWGALENQLRPAINLVITLDLDLNQVISTPQVLAKVLKFGRPVLYRDKDGQKYRMRRLNSGWEAAPMQLGGVIRHESTGEPIEDASVRLIGIQEDGRPIQVGSTIKTSQEGRYIFDGIPPGEYTLVIESSGLAPQQHPLTIAVRERDDPLPEFVHEVKMKRDT